MTVGILLVEGMTLTGRGFRPVRMLLSVCLSGNGGAEWVMLAHRDQRGLLSISTFESARCSLL